jgi:AraC-like DNA-binding protein
LEERFRHLMASTPSAELMSQPARELARRCGCSERHFRRLFKEQLGLPLKTWQIQLRLRKAARLLRASNTKVLDVALECGFPHLGQFNAAFKRLTGMTPSNWRQARPRRPQPVLCLRAADDHGHATPPWWQQLRRTIATS